MLHLRKIECYGKQLSEFWFRNSATSVGLSLVPGGKAGSQRLNAITANGHQFGSGQQRFLSAIEVISTIDDAFNLSAIERLMALLSFNAYRLKRRVYLLMYIFPRLIAQALNTAC